MEHGLGKIFIFDNEYEMKHLLISGIFCLMGLFNLYGYSARKSAEQKISDSLTVIANTSIFSEKINKVKININKAKDTVIITAGDNFGHLPFRKENVERIYHAMNSILSRTYPSLLSKLKPIINLSKN
jgi:hypothetical protein